MITPLCGNGMSMALHASRLAFTSLDDFLSGRTDRTQMEKEYTRTWNRTFEKRLAAGRWLQRLFGKPVFFRRFYPGASPVSPPRSRADQPDAWEIHLADGRQQTSDG